MASLDDILTTQKNGVIAINNLGQYIYSQFLYSRGQRLAGASAGTGGYVTLYTVPTGAQMAIVDMEICNTGGAPATFYISLVAANDSAGASNAIFYAAPIPGNTTVQWTGQQVLNAGGTVQAYASSANVSFRIGGGPG